MCKLYKIMYCLYKNKVHIVVIISAIHTVIESVSGAVQLLGFINRFRANDKIWFGTKRECVRLCVCVCFGFSLMSNCTLNNYGIIYVIINIQNKPYA